MSNLVKLFLIFLLLNLNFASANQCKIFERIAAKGLAEDANFWNAYAELPDLNDQKAIDKLIKQFEAKPKLAISNSPTVTTPPARIIETHRVVSNHTAAKEYLKLPEHLQKNVTEVIEGWTQSGKDFFKDKPSMNFERLSSGQFSVRLNQGYRLVFDSLADGTMKIVGIGNQVYSH